MTQQNSSKIGIKSGGRFLFIDPHDVIVVHAEGNYVLLQQETGSFEFIGLRLKGGKQYTVTRTYKNNLRSVAEFWIGTGTFPAD